jgi:hypothetical protein
MLSLCGGRADSGSEDEAGGERETGVVDHENTKLSSETARRSRKHPFLGKFDNHSANQSD